VVGAYKIVAGAQKAAEDDDRQRKIEAVVAAYSASQIWDVLAVDMVPILADSGTASAESALARIEGETIPEFRETVTANIAIRGVFDQVNTDAADYATERAAEMVGKRLVNGILIENPDPKWRIDEPTRDWIRTTVTQAFEEGMSPAELSKTLRGSYAFSKARAKTIAFTETGNINVRTHAVAAEASGATHKRTALSADHDDDDFCDEAAGQGEVEIDFDYGFGMKHPLFHPRCQCSISYYFRSAAVAA
jgi:hypothetical protein